MIVCTTMVLFILVETTSPIFVLRLPVFFAVALSAIYFFLFAALAVFFLAVFALAAFLGFDPLATTRPVLAGAALLAFCSVPPSAGADCWPFTGTVIPSSF